MLILQTFTKFKNCCVLCEQKFKENYTDPTVGFWYGPIGE